MYWSREPPVLLHAWPTSVPQQTGTQRHPALFPKGHQQFQPPCSLGPCPRFVFALMLRGHPFGGWESGWRHLDRKAEQRFCTRRTTATSISDCCCYCCGCCCTIIAAVAILLLAARTRLLLPLLLFCELRLAFALGCLTGCLAHRLRR